MHHDQDIRNMGGLWKRMPITWITSLLGSLALIGTPFFSGFYSKDSIIEALHESHLPAAHWAYWAAVIGVFVTAFYSFRMYFLVFHGKENFHHKPYPPEEAHDDHAHDEDHAHADGHGDDHGHGHGAHAHTPHESPWVVTLPLVLLAIPSVVIGYLTIGPMLFGDFFKDAITVDAHAHPAMEGLTEAFHGAAAMATHALTSLPFWLALGGVVTAFVFYLLVPAVPAALGRALSPLVTVMQNKYYMDWFNEHILAAGARGLGRGLWKGGDVAIIDGAVVNGSARLIVWIASLVRLFQTGYIYHYALVMLIGVFALMSWFVFQHG
jgi:NADH-quinone oxidoreductase subunit L